jgi:hypothetical protein
VARLANRDFTTAGSNVCVMAMPAPTTNAEPSCNQVAAAEQLWREALSKVTIADLADGIDEDSGGTTLGEVREWLGSH